MQDWFLEKTIAAGFFNDEVKDVVIEKLFHDLFHAEASDAGAEAYFEDLQWLESNGHLHSKNSSNIVNEVESELKEMLSMGTRGPIKLYRAFLINSNWSESVADEYLGRMEEEAEEEDEEGDEEEDDDED